ncbi:TonB-dependent receptor [Sphingomonas glacialis]|uniref:TonB-dependent receptor n=1 Tax=Sphingomonas glacialis TaxID=658225 RepID=A0A502FYG3_9SPHN|nr:TonB-dependent receptor [Sphingomonas glacialis]TPG54461.1 TonB-dependent receptor [Sphingomonas glacialis]
MRLSILAATISMTALCGAMPTAAWAADDAPAANSSADGAPDITVTARRRTEDLEKVPLAVSVVDSALLGRSYTVNTNQLSLLVPALNYSSANPRNTAFTIRGLGSSVVAVSQANDGLEPGVGFYVDQVYHARPATAAFDFSDIAQIEVLRGPQGTLFGKNTTAGAISITSKAPTFTPEASEELSVGSYNFVQAKASASGPLIGDTLAFRISGLTTRRDGVIDNVRTGAKENGIGNQAVRGQLLFKPTTDFQLRLTADFTNFESECCTQVYLRVGQSLRAATRQYAGPTGLAAQFGYAPPSTNPYDRKTNIDAQLGVNTNEGGVSAIADWNLGKIGTLTSVSAWRFWNWDAANDRDYTGIPVQITQHIPSRQDQFSQELRLASNGDHALGYVAGLYFFDQKITGEPISIYGPAAARYLIGTTTGTGAAAVAVPANLLDGYGTDGSTRLKEDSYAAFAELNYKLLPRLTLTGGLRYTYEVKDGSYSAYTFGGPTVTNAALLAAQLGVLRGQSYSGHDKESNLSGRANLAWQATDQLLAYASYARGFKSGGINLSGLPLNTANQPVLTTAVIRPELNTTYEAGLKTALFDRRLTLNLAGFYTDVHDFQATIVDSSQTVALRGYLSNIPKVTVKGVEADVTTNLTPRFQLRGNLAYAHGTYSNYPAGPCPLEVQTAATTACNLTGRPLAGLPKWSETIGGDYTLPVGKLAVILHADSSWRTSYYGDPSLSKYTLIDGYNVTNASLGVRTRTGLEVAMFVRNLFDANYIQNLTIQAGNSGLILGTPSDPRVIGVTLRAHQ